MLVYWRLRAASMRTKTECSNNYTALTAFATRCPRTALKHKYELGQFMTP
jgi:hypothetical protein